MAVVKKENPFFQVWDTPFAVPPFDRIRAEHFMPAFERGLEEQKREIATIAGNPAPATFENTLLSLEQSGQFLSRVSTTFNCLAGTVANDDLDQIDLTIAPILSQHSSDIYQNHALFKKVGAVYQARDMLPMQARRVVEKYYRRFENSGAALPEAAKNEIKAIEERLSTLSSNRGINRCISGISCAAMPSVIMDMIGQKWELPIYSKFLLSRGMYSILN